MAMTVETRKRISEGMRKAHALKKQRPTRVDWTPPVLSTPKGDVIQELEAERDKLTEVIKFLKARKVRG